MADDILSACASKVCKTCSVEKPFTAFARASSCLDGHRGSCKACGATSAAARAKRWRERNPERAKEVNARYAEKHPDRRQAASRKNYEKNADERRANRRVFYHENKEACQAANAAWMEKNKEHRMRYSAARRRENPEKLRAAYAAWGAANPEARKRINQNRRARKLGNGGVLSKGLKAKLMTVQKGLCACCKQPLGANFHMDHIMPLALGGKNEDDNMQLLRAFCNLSKKDRHPVDYMQSKGFLL